MATGPKTVFATHTTPRNEDPADWLRLIRSRRVGAVTFHRLLAEHGTAADALAALPDIARASGVENYAICPVEVIRAEMAQARLCGAVMLRMVDAGYPALLREISDAPPVIWAQGDLTLLTRPMVAMVGARNASSLGIRMARRLAEGLGAAGLVVVSGLARGIDAEAHRAALATGTIAVQAGGVDVIYPIENTELAAEIAASGCRISEQPMGIEPQTRHFPQRNRIISGMCRAVVVVEAAARSGSLITARSALDQGREVLAVPGHPFDARAAGCNILLRDGATLVRGPQDVMEALGTNGARPPPVVFEDMPEQPAFPPIPGPPIPGPVPLRRTLADISAVHSRILARLGPSPLAEDQLIRDLALPPSMLSPALMSLELDGKVLRQPGGLLSRID